jgi:regulator of replication initiation timing
MTPIDPEWIKLREEIHNLRRELVALTKKNIALRADREKWRKKFEELSVSKIKTVRIKVNGDDHP